MFCYHSATGRVSILAVDLLCERLQGEPDIGKLFLVRNDLYLALQATADFDRCDARQV